MSRTLLPCIALLSMVATPALAAVPSVNALTAQMDQARASLRERLATRPDQAPQLRAALARLTQVRDTAMSARHIQGGILSAGQRERLSHRIAAATAAALR